MDKVAELRIHELVNQSLEGTIEQAGMQELNRLVASDLQCAGYYVSCIKLHFAFSKAGPLLRERGHAYSPDSTLLQELAEYEMTAPGIEIPKNGIEDACEPSAGIEQARAAKISKTPLMTVLVSCAALLMVLIYIYLKPVAIEVATLTDAVDAQWYHADKIMSPGTRLLTGQPPVILTRGVVKFLYDNDVEVLIEAPAEYQIQSSCEIRLNYGRLFARVSDAGKGFSVRTSNTTIVDLGTEFGVYADSRDKTELHVFKGKTTATARVNNSVQNIGVIGGQAREIDAAGQTRDIHLKKDSFVRAIDSKTNLVWRGQNLNLADMVGGRNGLEAGRSTVRIDPSTGFMQAMSQIDYSLPNTYHLVSQNVFVDGIFVPDGESEQVVSSRGDIFAECPTTSGVSHTDLIANPQVEIFKTGMRRGTIQFDGQVYGDPGRPCIVMHANIGVTFDLDAIRGYYPDHTITRFISRAGIADLQEPYPCNAGFWVLVDGRIRYCVKHFRQKGVLQDIAVDIGDSDRFLTLVTTDGGDVDIPEAYKRSITCDWCVFTEPVLVME